MSRNPQLVTSNLSSAASTVLITRRRALLSAAGLAVAATLLPGFTPHARATTLKGITVDIGSGAYSTSYTQLQTLLGNNQAYWVSFSFGVGGTLNLTADSSTAPPIASTMSGTPIYINAEGGYVTLSGFSGGSGSGSYDYPGLVSTSARNTIVLENGTFGGTDYSGVTAGTIQIGGGTATLAATIVSGGGLPPGPGATIAFNFGTFSNAFAAGGVVPYNILVSGASNVINGGGAAGTFTGSFSGSGALQLQDATFELAPPGPTLTNAGFIGTLDVETGATVLLDSQGALTSGGFIIDGGALKNNSGGALNFSPANTIAINSGGFTFDAYGQSSILQGVISGAGGLTISDTSSSGGGVVNLNPTDSGGNSKPNTYTGGTIIQDGVTAGFTNSASFGTGTITVDATGGTLKYGAGRLTPTNPLQLIGNATIDAGGFTGANAETYTGAIRNAPDTGGQTLTIQNGTLSLTNSSNQNDFTSGTLQIGDGAHAATVQAASPSCLPGANVSIELNAGTLKYTGASSLTLPNNVAGAADMNNALDAGGNIIVLGGAVTNRSGTLALQNGTFSSASASAGNTFANFTGGTLQVGSSSGAATLELSDNATTGALYLPGSNASIALNGGTVAMPATLQQPTTISNNLQVTGTGGGIEGVDNANAVISLAGSLNIDTSSNPDEALVLLNGVFSFTKAGNTTQGVVQVGNGTNRGVASLQFNSAPIAPTSHLALDDGGLVFVSSSHGPVTVPQDILVDPAGGFVETIYTGPGSGSEVIVQPTGDLSGPGKLSVGSLALDPSAGNNLAFTGTLQVMTNLTLDSQNAVTGGGFEVGGPSSFGGTFTNNTNGPLVLSAANTISMDSQANLAIDTRGRSVTLRGIISSYNYNYNYWGGQLTLEDTTGSGGIVNLDPTNPAGQSVPNTYSGGTIVAGVTATFGNSGAFGSGPIMFANGGTLMPTVAGLNLPNNIGLTDSPSSSTPDVYNTNGTTSEISGNLHSADVPTLQGGLIVDGGGTLLLSGTNRYAGGTIVRGGSTLAAGSSSALGTGDVNLIASNLATINAIPFQYSGSPLAIHVGGNYSQDGGSALLLTMAGPDNYDVLQVAGTATLGGHLLIEFFGGFHPSLGEKFTVVTAGGINGHFSSVSGTNEPVVFSQVTTSTTDVITVETIINQLNSTAAQNMAYLGIQSSIIAGEQLFDQMENMLTGGTGGFNASSLNIIDTPNADPFSTALASAMQSVGRAAQASANTDPIAYLDSFDSHSPTSPSGPVPLPRSELANTISGFAAGEITVATDLPGSAPGQSGSFNTGGAVTGLGYNMAGHLVIGPLFSYNYTGSNLDNIGSRLRASAYSPGIFVGLRKSHFHFEAFVDYTYNAYHIDRNVTLPAGVATSNPNGDQFDVSSQLTYYFHVARGLKLGPSAGLGFTNLTISGYTESGDGAGDMTISPMSFDSLRSLLGGQLSYAWRPRPTAPAVTFTANAYWQHEYLNLSRGVIAQPIGGSSFVTDTPAHDRDSALLGCGVSGDLARNITLFVDYQAQIGPGRELVNSAMAGLAIALR